MHFEEGELSRFEQHSMLTATNVMNTAATGAALPTKRWRGAQRGDRQRAERDTSRMHLLANVRGER